MKAFIITRDRATYAKRTAEAFDAAGLETIIVDHGSTYPPAVEWLDEREASGGPVYRRGGGLHPRTLWSWDVFQAMVYDERYIVSDPDTPPSEDCPGNWLEHLGEILDRHPSYPKVGLGLRFDNLPDHYQRKHQVIQWETQYWQHYLEDGVLAANVDTTIALHKPLSDTGSVHVLTGMRTGHPYVADHLPWYENYDNLTDEIRYYYEHSESDISFWASRGKSCYWQD